MAEEEIFAPEGSALKRGCLVSDTDVNPCPCGSGRAFARCHGADCECGSKKPKYKCCHSEEF
ncbi:MAG: SEC-C domain-containing protein [Deltaproteobacteria bacterium]|nr:SEC-C domain-containing protein [Deltaproteobacteria bacterium]